MPSISRFRWLVNFFVSAAVGTRFHSRQSCEVRSFFSGLQTQYFLATLSETGLQHRFNCSAKLIKSSMGSRTCGCIGCFGAKLRCWEFDWETRESSARSAALLLPHLSLPLFLFAFLLFQIKQNFSHFNNGSSLFFSIMVQISTPALHLSIYSAAKKSDITDVFAVATLKRYF